VIEAADAIQHAHMRGILHRDLKPANLLIDPQGHPHITDFGLAKLIESDVELTASGAIMGTPAYMSPEQAAGRRGAMTLATDVYGLGAILYALLTGKAPFGGDSVLETLDAVRTRPPERPTKRNARVPRDLELICLKCLEKNPADRYATAGALADDLRHWTAGEPVSVRAAGAVERVAKWARRKPTLAAAYSLGLLALLLGGLGGAAVWQWRAAARARDVAATARDGEAQARAKTQTALDRATVSEAAAVEARDGEARARATLARVEYGRTMEVALQEWRDNNPAATRALLESIQAEFRGWEWRYLQRLCHSELLELKGHTSYVGSASYSPDGSRIVTASTDGTAKLWDARTGAELLTLKGHTNAVSSASYSPDGSRVLTMSPLDHSVGVWDARTGAELLTLEGNFFTASYSPDGSQVLTAETMDNMGWTKVWDAGTGAELLTLKGRMGSYLVSASYSPDGSRVLTADNKGWTKVWDARTGTEILTIEGHSTPLSSAAFSPDGSRVVTTSTAADGSAKVWDARTGTELFTLKGRNDGFDSASFSPDGSRVLTRGGDGEIKVWDARTGAEVCTIKGGLQTGSGSISFSPDGSRIVVAKPWDKTVQVWDVRTGAEILTLKGHTHGVLSASFSPDGSRVVTGSLDLTAKVWDARSGPESFRFKEPDPRRAVTLAGAVRSASFSPDGSRVLTTGSSQTAQVWDAASGDEVLTLEGHSGVLVDGSFSPDGSRVVTQSMFGTTTIWDARTGAEILTLKESGRSRGFGTGLPSDRRTAAFSPDGSRVVTTSPDSSAQVWDARTGAEILALKGQTNLVSSASFSPDGSRVLSALTVWDVRTGAEILALKGQGRWGSSAAFSLDGSRVVSGCYDNTARVWDARTGAELLTLKGHTDQVSSASFSPDGSRIVTASGDQTVKLWDATSGAELLTLKHTGTVKSAAFSPDGTRIVTVVDYGKAKIWDARPFQGSALARANRLPAILNGEDQPADTSERLAFARLAYDGKRFTAAARHWAEALAGDPNLDTNCWNHYRFHAACAAALAAAGQGQDEPSLDGAATARLRRQALDWLKTELTAWRQASQVIEPRIQEKVGDTLAHWKEGADLASIRDERELAGLPEEEREEWQSLWADVELLLKPIREKPPAAPRFRTKQAASEYKRVQIVESLTSAAKQAWLGQQKEYSATCDRVLELAKDAKDPTDADRAAKICSLRASDAKTHEAALDLARRAVELGKGHQLMGYFQMALGMAEYRCGHYAEADGALRDAARLGGQDYYVSVTTAFYRAMSLFKQGKEAEARKLASEAIPKMKPLPADEKNPLTGDDNADDLILWMAFKEASTLLGLTR
jgi:WD40 repeat protein